MKCHYKRKIDRYDLKIKSLETLVNKLEQKNEHLKKQLDKPLDYSS